MSESFWASIIAAIIGVIGTIIASRFKEIKYGFRGMLGSSKYRNLRGTWDIKSFRVISENGELKKGDWVGDYSIEIKQRGEIISGTMSAVKVLDHMDLYNYKWDGNIHGEYLTYGCTSTDPAYFMLSVGQLYIHSIGQKMSGYFVANSGHNRIDRNWVGYTELKRRKDE
ncbi:MAG: hypothetical protein DWQ05_10695 [Calditrichaeota bacterium]|nr:MAG: hypothetical protein DWQ05_10695 [Calditrichota bacterium]